MQLALPRPYSQNLAIPFVTLILGAAGGAAVTAALNEDDVIRLPQVDAATQSPSAAEPGVKLRAGGPATSGELLKGQPSGANQPTGENNFGARP